MAGHPIKRCNLFREDGTPRRLADGTSGCGRGQRCFFIHPDNPMWETLPPSRLPKLDIIHPDEHPKWDPHRSASFDRPPRLRTPPRSELRRSEYVRVPGPDSPTERRKEERGHKSRRRSRSRSPESSIASSREPRSPTTRIDSRASGSHREGRGRGSSYDRSSPSRLREATQDRNAGSGWIPVAAPPVLPPSPVLPPPPVPPPPPKPSVAAMQPLVPLPIPPSFLSTSASKKDAAPPANEPNLQEKKALWVDRIKRITECLDARASHAQLEAELRKLQRLRQSARYADLTPAVQTVTNAQLTDVEVRFERAKGELSAASARVQELNTWPLASRADVQAAEGRYRELVEHVGGLKDTITQLNQALQAPRQPADAEGDVDDSGPRKRRRMSTSGRGNADGDHRPASSREPLFAPDEEGVERIRKQLETLQGSVRELEKKITVERQRDLVKEIEGLVETKMEEIGLRRDKAPDKPEHTQALTDLEANVNLTGDQVGEIAVDVAALIGQLSAQEVEIRRLQERFERLEARDVEHERSLKAYEEKKDQSFKEIQALNAALQAYVERPTMPPHVVAPELLLDAVEDSLLRAVRGDVEGLLKTSQQQVQENIKQRNAELFAAVWNKLSLVLEMMETVRRQIAQEDGGS